MSYQPKILIVDDRADNLFTLQRLLSPLQLEVIEASSGEEALGLTLDHDFCVALVDIQMPGMDGYEMVELLRGNTKTASLPVIFVSAVYSDEYHHRKAYESGAVDFMTKPLNPQILFSKVRVFIELHQQRLQLQEIVAQLSLTNLEVRRLNSSLEEKVRQRTSELETTRMEVIRQLGRAAEFRDKETGQHVERVSQYVRLLAVGAGVEPALVELYYTIAPLHDIGKIGIPDHILLKPGALSVEEMEIMRQHARIGAEIIGDHPSELFRVASTGCLTHHERWNGLGYPQGLHAAGIPLIGRLLALADVFDAVTSNRPYKKAWTIEEARLLVEEERGAYFDPLLVDIFLRKWDDVERIYHNLAD
ncbi:MAG: response regulator [Anaerolineales bacterium]|nr:response regulator [Anaerolineales bacterium]